MSTRKSLLSRYTSVSLVLRNLIGLVIGALLGLAVPSWTQASASSGNSL